MKESVKRKWTAALTSGKYKQTTDRLKRIDGNGKSSHCCLGVLCELYIKDVEPKLRWTKDGGEYLSQGEGEIPPGKVLEWAGLNRKSASELAEMNDSGSTFKEIAEKINGVKTVRWANQYGRGVKKIAI